MPFRPTRIAAPMLALLLLLGLWSSRSGPSELFEQAAPPPPAAADEPPVAKPGAARHAGEVKRRRRAVAEPVAAPVAEPSAKARKAKKAPRKEAPRKEAAVPVADAPDEKAPPARTVRKRLPPVGTVRGAIARVRRSGAISAHDGTRYRRIWQRARKLRSADVAAVASIVRRLAGRRKLRPDRMPVLFLQLRRNVQVARSGKRPAPGERFTFGRDPVILQYIPGQGLQFHPLANFAEANRLRNACVGYRTRPGVPCRKRKLARLADRLAELAVRRAGFTTWEYYFDFTGGRAPWISSMAQATGMQALSRTGKLLKRRKYVRVARSARGAFHRAAPAGVRVGDGNYAMYSFAPELVVFNGLLQTVSGLHDYAEISGDRRGRRLFGAGDRYARRLIPRFDTGSWSLYSRPGGRATREYHQLTSVFLRNLCERTERASYCTAAKRFRSYL